MSVQVSYKKQFVLGILLLIVIFSVIEGIARIFEFYDPQCGIMRNELFKNESPFLKYQICQSLLERSWTYDPVVGMAVITPNQHSSTININSYGFRGPEITMEKPDDIYRIFVVGGSTTFNVRAPSDEHTIPGYLDYELNNLQTQKIIQVINAGMPGMTSSGELLLIKNKIVNFEPDLIIIYDGFNDLWKTELGWIRDYAPNIKKSDERQTMIEIKTYFKTPYLVNEIFKEISKIDVTPNENSGHDEKKVVTQSEEKASLWLNNMAEICEMGQNGDFKTLIALQPFLGTGNKTLTDHEIKKGAEHWDITDASLKYQNFGNKVNDLEPLCDKVVDLRNIFDNVTESVYFEHVHIHYRYNKMVAERLAELSLPLIQK